MKFIIGLGNPGKKYETTRHNVGFVAVDMLREHLGFSPFEQKKAFDAFISQGVVDNEKVLLAKPLSYMNRSGSTTSKLLAYYKSMSKDVLVIHDDVDILLGSYKIQLKRSSAGHRGVQSVIDSLGTKDFWRIRIGTGSSLLDRKITPTDSFVVGKFTATEKKIIDKIVPEIVELSKVWIKK